MKNNIYLSSIYVINLSVKKTRHSSLFVPRPLSYIMFKVSDVSTRVNIIYMCLESFAYAFDAIKVLRKVKSNFLINHFKSRFLTLPKYTNFQ